MLCSVPCRHTRRSVLIEEGNHARFSCSKIPLQLLYCKYRNHTREEDLQARLAHPLALSDPQALVEKGGQLLQMRTWPEVVLGIGLNTGRSLAEILKTGIFRAKTAYSVLFSGPMT